MKHGQGAVRKFRNAVRISSRVLPGDMPAGFFLTEPGRTPDPISVVQALPDGIGVILRHFGRPEQIALAAPLASLCRQQGRIFLVAADPDTARSVKADGVHWPCRLASIAARHTRSFAINTMSAHNSSQLRGAGRAGVDGIILSTVFPSASPSASDAIGLMRFAATARNAGLSVYGLGGIDQQNVGRIAHFGGFAAVSGLFRVFG